MFICAAGDIHGAMDRLYDDVFKFEAFLANDIRVMHHRWLRELYEWAGEYRTVNISKGTFTFAAAVRVPALMKQLEHGPLREYTPRRFDTLADQASALAIVHSELILVHPFRDGNGRCARLLAMLMGLQAGLPALDFGGIRGARKREYIAAVHTALDRDYEPMIKIFRGVIERTLRTASKASSG
jgi:cell filamentation protein